MTNTTRTSAAVQEVNVSLQPLSRRRFLKYGLWLSAGAIALVAGGFSWLRRSPLDEQAVPAGLSHLQPAHYHLFRQLAQVMLPVDGTTLLPADQIDIAARVDQLLAGIDAAPRKQLLTGLTLLDNLAVLGGGHGGRLVDMPAADAAAYIDRWVNSSIFPLRAIANAAGRLVKTAYWSDPQTWSAIDYPGPVTRARGIPSLGNAPMPIR